MSRLFFALRPPGPVASAIMESRKRTACAGRAIPGQRLHLTLRFLGEVPECKVAPLIAAASNIQSPGFNLKLQPLGYFTKPQIAWVGPCEFSAGLEKLVRATDDACEAVGLGRRVRGFKPHVTLARKAQAPKPAAFEQAIFWPVSAFYLCESFLQEGRLVYRNRASWFLTDAAGN